MLLERNRVLGKVFDNLQNKQFQICNKTADTVTVNWLAAAYQDGQADPVLRQLALPRLEAAGAGAGRCPLPDAQLRPGELQLDHGDVVYYAMQYTRESEDAVNTINFVGHFKGYDRDCHNIQ